MRKTASKYTYIQPQGGGFKYASKLNFFGSVVLSRHVFSNFELFNVQSVNGFELERRNYDKIRQKSVFSRLLYRWKKG